MPDLAASRQPSALPVLNVQPNDAMVHTLDAVGEPDPSPMTNLDTLTAQDAEPDANLDDSLLRRDLKSKIFGASSTVRIDRYEILRRIGRGGMGTVYVAHDPELDRNVALKVLRPDRRSGRDRMLKEARALARLAHPNVVTVHEVGVHDDRVFVAMELVEGMTLRSWLEGSPSRAALWSVFAQAASGLQAAHRAGLVHRDFKPENVLIGDDGRVRVVDFGVVKTTDTLDENDQAESLDPSAVEPGLTQTGQLLGTPAYMAAEQFLGEAVDARTDVFAFCASLYESLAGHRPFAGEDAGEVARSVLEGTFTPLDVTDLPASTRTLIERGLSRNPDDRPHSMDGFVEALGRSPAVLPFASPRRPVWTVRAIGAVVGSVIGLGLVGIASFAAFRDTPTPAPSDATAAAMPNASANADAGDDGSAPSATDSARAAAFATIVAASDDHRRHTAAAHFLETYGQSAQPVQLAIAHSIVGDTLWRASCPHALLGLCVDEQPARTEGDRCEGPQMSQLVPRPRVTDKAVRAQQHFGEALSRAGVQAPDDPQLRELFGTAVGRARVQQADAALEDYLALRLPQGLDFADAALLSSDAFGAYVAQATRIGRELSRSYAAVKQSGSPYWVLVAASRTGLIGEKFGMELGNAALPKGLPSSSRDAYCKELTTVIAPPLAMGTGAYTYCVSRADQFDVKQPEVEFCRERLAVLQSR
ncbi:MAG: serine/threonine protein kinase [Deltaproteobacteria bacterium]|nr:serine/threonine protein kinase [Deltaproteobacteria bacterium]